MDFAPAAALLFASIPGIFIAGLSPLPGRPLAARAEYAVFAPPWYDLGKTIALSRKAGALIDGVGRFGNIVIVRSADPQPVAALYRAGAWLVVEPNRLWGCGATAGQPAPTAGAR